MSNSDTERCFAMTMLWSLWRTGSDPSLSPAGEKALREAIAKDPLQANMARRMLIRMGVDQAQLTADFGPAGGDDEAGDR